MPAKNRLDTIVTLVMGLSSLAIAGTVGWLNFGPPSRPQAEVPVEVDDWKLYASGTKVMGASAALVTIVEFSDFQCPFCAVLSARLKRVMQKHPRDVRLVYRNVPIQSLHPHARDAALASECAAAQGRFAEYHDALFENQNKIGVTPWTEVAMRVGVPDTARLAECMTSQFALAELRADSVDAAVLGVTGTPTLLVNQWRVNGAPTEVQLEALITNELKRAR